VLISLPKPVGGYHTWPVCARPTVAFLSAELTAVRPVLNYTAS